MLNGDEYAEQLHTIAQSYDCGLRLAPRLPGMMYVEHGYVEGPDPRTPTPMTPQMCFLVGLHEIGHFVLDHTQGRPPFPEKVAYFENGVLRSEAQAWDFALDVMEDAGEEIEEESRHFMWNVCLNSYYTHAQALNGRPTRLSNGDRGYVEFVFDEPDEVFFSAEKRIKGV